MTEPCSLKFSVVGYLNCFHESKGCKFSLTSFVSCVCEHVGGERRRRKGKGGGREKEEEGEGRREREGGGRGREEKREGGGSGRECWTSSVTIFSLVIQGCIHDGNVSSHRGQESG